MIHKKAVESEEMVDFLQNVQKLNYLSAILNAKVYTIEDLIETTKNTPEWLKGVPRMISRIFHKKALERMETQELRNLLSEMERSQYLEPLLACGISNPQQLCRASAEDMNIASNDKGISKMMARILIRKARELCPSLTEPDEPSYQKDRKAVLDDPMIIANIEKVHSILLQTQHHETVGEKTVTSSFGERYYSILVSMDSEAVQCFNGVSLVAVGREFDALIDKFVAALKTKDGKGEEFSKLSDTLVQRMTHYRVPTKTLWMGNAAFTMAAMAVAPEVDLMERKYLESWNKLYFAMIPPLHPILLRSTSVISKEEVCGNFHHSSFAPQLYVALARRGYLYITHWLEQQEANNDTGFVPKLEAVVRGLCDWQEQKSNPNTFSMPLWKQFETAAKALLEGMDSVEMKLTFLIELPLAVRDLISAEDLGDSLGRSLLIVAATLFGMDRVVQTI